MVGARKARSQNIFNVAIAEAEGEQERLMGGG